MSSGCPSGDERLYGLQGRRGTGNPGRGFASRPIGLRLECSPKDYLIGCGLGFRIKVWHLPKNWVGARRVENTRRGPQDLPGSARPSWVSESQGL